MPKTYSKRPWTGRSNDRRTHMVFLNSQIKAPTIVIVDEEWNKLWAFPRRKALEMAEEKGLDLVQMNYDASKMVSTVKMVDYWKYMYKKQKDEKEKKKSQKIKGFKEIKVSYMIGENDLAMKTRKVQELLEGWYNVKIMIRLRWRERWHSVSAKAKLMAIVEKLEAYGRSQYGTPKKEAQWYSISLFTKIK